MKYVIAFHLICTSIVLILSQIDVKEIVEDEQIWTWIIRCNNSKGLF